MKPPLGGEPGLGQPCQPPPAAAAVMAGAHLAVQRGCAAADLALTSAACPQAAPVLLQTRGAGLAAAPGGGPGTAQGGRTTPMPDCASLPAPVPAPRASVPPRPHPAPVLSPEKPPNRFEGK